MRALRALLILGLAVLTIGCSTLSVQYDYDPQADFASLKTFDWLPAPVDAEVSGLTVKRIKNAVTSQLEARGFKETSEDPNFLIALHVGKKDRLAVTDWGYWGYDYLYWGGGVDVYEYEEGTLIIDFVNARSKEPIWRGVARETLDPNPTPAKEEKRINEAVTKILKNFPPVASK
jgi:hypothetical protein